MKKGIVAVVGRPNVGKSTLFNRIVGKKHAIVNDLPGVTRDYREADSIYGDLNFIIIDTAGLEYKDGDALSKEIFRKSELAINKADLVLFVVDAQVGVTSEDEHYAKWIHKKNKNVILVINKSESSKVTDNIQEFYRLGFKNRIAISAEHGEGVGYLFEMVSEELIDFAVQDSEESDKEELNKNTVLQISIVGRPNAGKSTLMNKIINEERVITGPEPGITRDAISVNWEYKGRKIKLIDTAGIRKKTTIHNEIEQLSVDESIRAILFSQIVILLMDVDKALEQQDVAIAELALKEGRGLILAFNKCDDSSKMKSYLNKIDDIISLNAKFLDFVPKIVLSAKNDWNIDKLIAKAFQVYDEWNVRIPTAKLNNWLIEATGDNPHPLAKNKKSIRFKYATQSKTRPPYFTFFANYPDQVKDNYKRFLVNSLRKSFDLQNVPIKINIKGGKNPYSK